MIVDKLRNTRVTTLVLFFLIGILFWLRPIIEPELSYFPFTQDPPPLFGLLFGWLGQFPLISVLMGFALHFILAYLVARLNENYYLIERRNYFAPVFFILIAASIFPLQRVHPALLGALFMILSIEKVFESYRNADMTANLFNAAFLLSIGSLFYFPLVFLMPVLWAGLVVVRPFSLREWLLTLTGLLNPYILLFGFAFFFGRFDDFAASFLRNFISHSPIVFIDLGHILLFSFLVVLIFLASLDMLKAFNQKKIRIRKYFKILFWFFWFSLALFLIHPSVSVEVLVLLALPVSFLLSNYFTFLKNIRFADLLIVIFVILVSYAQW